MQYPLISEYVNAIIDSGDNLDKLSNLKPVMDSYGEPVHSSGAFAVVFKMVDNISGRNYALKCFTTDQPGRLAAYAKISAEIENIKSKYLISVKYYDKELFVSSACTDETEFPVLLMDWVDGVTMESYIPGHFQSASDMSWLTYRFCELAAWLHEQNFAHGDMKTDNIMVKPDGSLVLIDYDSMYVPAMHGEKSPTLGSRDYSHPLRKTEDFNEGIDDFTITAMALSLKAISLDPQVYTEYGTADGMILTMTDYLDLGKSKKMTALCKYLSDPEFCRLYGNFLIANDQKDLSLHSFRNLLVSKPSK